MKLLLKKTEKLLMLLCLILVLFFNIFAFANTLKENVKNVANKLQSGDWETRGKAAIEMMKITDITIEEKTRLLSSTLQKECLNKTSDEIPVGSYKTISAYLKDQYVFGLADQGSEAISYIREKMNKAEGEYKDRLILALGLLKDKDTKISSRIIKLGENSQDGYIRTLAMRVIAEWADKKFIPILKKGLKDNFKVNIHTDFITPNAVKGQDGRYYEEHYPVRHEAASGLLKLGINIRGSGNEFLVETP